MFDFFYQKSNIKKNLYMEMTYQELQELLKKSGLFIKNQPFAVTGNNELFLTANITTGSEIISIRRGACHSYFSFSGKDQNELVKNFWETTRKSELLIGHYNDYKEIIEWSESDDCFKRRPLTKNEELDLNHSL